MFRMESLHQEKCRICTENLTKKQRRLIFSDAFKVFGQLVEVLGYVPKNSDAFVFDVITKLTRFLRLILT